jgi:hypothetical protein
MKRVVALAVLTGAFLLSLQTGSAQQSVPYPLRASPDRVRALVQAWNDGLPYVPGEVLVKFRPGAAAGRASVLSLLRGAAATRQETWIGDTLLVRSTADPESPAVAFQLAQQPEVEWAQPNYLLRTGATPTDPSYFRQWNMDAIRMPEAWDINPGAGPAVTVAIIDTGVTAMGQTLQPTALVHEAYMKLIDQTRVNWQGASSVSVSVGPSAHSMIPSVSSQSAIARSTSPSMK